MPFELIDLGKLDFEKIITLCYLLDNIHQAFRISVNKSLGVITVRIY